ncbi:hypothetical protein M8J76_007695 [Diaphorina citri]|nr:hypothetical protein M8J76_007695 [Diaphorina citri]
MTSESIITEDIEIRHLKQYVVHELGIILNERDDWKKIMSIVTVDCDPLKPLKYSAKDIKIVERAGKRNFPERGCTDIFLDEWGTSGRRRPRLSDLIMFLKKAELHQAARYVEVDVLKKPESPGDNTEAAEWLQEVIQQEEANNKTEYIGELIAFTFCDLERATDGFNRKPYPRRGNKLGEGQFGTVYYGKLKNGMEIAVKTLENNANYSSSNSDNTEAAMIPILLFENEVQTLSQCKHVNLLRLLGFCNNIMNCIVYEYMCNGSLYDRLARVNNTPPLDSNKRYSIALGVAEALHYLHSLSKPIIHRDVKSANVLLDENFVPKLGDFGIVKMSETSNVKTMYTENLTGTRPYMPPEAMHCQISTKTDVFSYGVILLELLTGMKPIDDNNTILYYYLVVEQEVPVREVLDKEAGEWNETHVETLISIVFEKCCVFEKDKRASMRDIVDLLSKSVND